MQPTKTKSILKIFIKKFLNKLKFALHENSKTCILIIPKSTINKILKKFHLKLPTKTKILIKINDALMRIP
jgi:hypothetical protein